MPDKASTFIISRTFNTSRDKLWDAWTVPALMAQWFGPKGTKAEAGQMDLRPGGSYHSCLKTPEDREMWGKFVYREVSPPRRLIWVHSFSDKDGGITRHPANANWPLELLTTVIFEDMGNKAKVTLTWQPVNATEAEIKTFEENMKGMEQGWGGSFEQLEEFLRLTKAA